MDSPAASAFITYPNPAVNKVSLQFDAVLDGEYRVDITNQVGQAIVSRALKLKNTSLININLGNNQPPGIYYVRVKDAASGQLYTSKLMINR